MSTATLPTFFEDDVPLADLAPPLAPWRHRPLPKDACTKSNIIAFPTPKPCEPGVDADNTSVDTPNTPIAYSPEFTAFLINENVVAKLKAIISNQITNWQDVEELLNDTILAAWKARERLDLTRSSLPFVYAICRHKIHNFLRKLYRSPDHYADSFDDQTDGACTGGPKVALEKAAALAHGPEQANRERVALVRAFVETLADKEKQVCDLYAEGHSYDVIAERLGIHGGRRRIADCIANIRSAFLDFLAANSPDLLPRHE